MEEGVRDGFVRLITMPLRVRMIHEQPGLSLAFGALTVFLWNDKSRSRCESCRAAVKPLLTYLTATRTLMGVVSQLCHQAPSSVSLAVYIRLRVFQQQNGGLNSSQSSSCPTKYTADAGSSQLFSEQPFDPTFGCSVTSAQVEYAFLKRLAVRAGAFSQSWSTVLQSAKT